MTLQTWDQRVGQPAGGECVPRFFTPRTDRETIGDEVAAFARLLGKPPMPWQADLFDRAFELDHEGYLWYREIVVVVPRQSGKTTIIVPWGVHRCTTWPERQIVLYTAQSRIAARKKWLSDQWYLINRSPFVRLIQPNRSGLRRPNMSHGEEHFPWVNGSEWGVDAPTETAGHGPTLDLGIADEFFSQKDGRVEAAMSPAMITRRDSQKLFISTPGDSKAKSPQLWSKVEAGRNRVRAGLDSRTLYVEYSAPEDVDWLDPLVWWQTMPALGYTVTEEKVQAEADSMGEEKFRRAYLAQWADDFAVDTRIPWAAWMLCHDEHSKAGDLHVWVPEVTSDRSHGAISLASRRPDGLIHVEVIDSQPGSSWIAARLGVLTRAHGGEVWYDPVTAGALAPDIETELPDRVPLAAATGQDVKVSAAALLDAVLVQSVAHLNDPVLNDALIAARARKIGDTWAWSMALSQADITPVKSLTLAHWTLVRRMADLAYDPLGGIR